MHFEYHEFEIFNGATSDQIDFWNDMIAGFVILPFDSSAARSAVNIQNRLKTQRKSIEKADLFIAAVAVSNNLVFDTLNQKHFEFIDSLLLSGKGK